MPSDVLRSLASAYVKVSSETLTSAEISALWSFIYGVEAAIKLSGEPFDEEQLDREIEALCRG